ncbi:hypothetical protein Slin15195_G052090 [Septoria linicola]|uniref:Uncharacterized protein n=1 Tax=Septoria linicola TaxID=215465 RepID=A0A9Q9AMW2_9PEZI|nr:hypothetical protein Slin15195_G052090 [Septoria linicola]
MWPAVGLHAGHCVQDALVSADKIASISVSAGSATGALGMAEAFLWMATACREHEGGAGVGYCSMDMNTEADLHGEPIFETATVADTDTSGLCWTKMVSNPVIAHGYPIPLREHPDKQRGLEASADLMAALSQADWATSYAGTVLLKGLVSALIPIYKVSSSLVWHFVLETKQDGSRLTYNEALHFPNAGNLDIDVDTLDDHRHFIGIWSDAVSSMAGSNDPNLYDVQLSQSKPAKQYTCSLSNVSISAGKFLNAGAAFALGNKDRSAALDWNATERYELQIRNVGELNIALYGSESHDRRAWLLDGASVVLHLARAWMSSESARYMSADALNRLQSPRSPRWQRSGDSDAHAQQAE